LAMPMWVLFEVGLIFSRLFARRREGGEEQEAVPVAVSSADAQSARASSAAAATGAADPIPAFDGDPSPDQAGTLDPERFVPLTEEELDAELDLIEEDEDDDDEEGHEDDDEETPFKPGPVAEKLYKIQTLRDRGDVAGARQLLYEVLAEGNADQINVARNILQQLDDS